MKAKTTSPTRKPKKGSSPKKGKKATRKSLSSFFLFRRFPVWLLLLGGLLVTAAYVAFFYYVFVNPFSFRWRAIYGEPAYPEGFEVRGIDISHYQDRIDWNELKSASIGDAPVSFVFIKATEGEKLCDDSFEKNFSNAKESGLIRGAYHFFVPGADPRRQADFFLRVVHLEPGDLPPVLDIEKQGNLTPLQLQHDIKVWLDEVEAAYGVKPILYTGYKFKLDYLNSPEFDAYPYWIAHYYVEQLKYQGRWAFWQHTDCGRVSGIKGFVDCNIFNGTLYDLQMLTLPDRDEQP